MITHGEGVNPLELHGMVDELQITGGFAAVGGGFEKYRSGRSAEESVMEGKIALEEHFSTPSDVFVCIVSISSAGVEQCQQSTQQ